VFKKLTPVTLTAPMFALACVAAMQLSSAAVAAQKSERGRAVAGAPDAQSQMMQRDPVSPNPRTATMRRNADAVKQTLTTGSVNTALQTSDTLRDPKVRTSVAAGLATATLERGKDGWWRHRDGRYGWVGPVFWPFAAYDMFGYALSGDRTDASFWNYGYGDVYAGLFGPYPYDTLTGYARYLPTGDDAGSNNNVTLARICGNDSRDIAGLPADVLQNALQPDDAQRSMIDDLAHASQRASRLLKAACPTTIALTAPARIATMQQRVGAMIAAVKIVQPSLDVLYASLSDEQKAQLASLATEQASQSAATQSKTSQSTTVGTAGSSPTPVAQTCAAIASQSTEWPKTAIERSVVPTAEQQRSLDRLKAATAKAAEMLNASCQPGDTSTPPARLVAVVQRLETMSQALNTVSVALNESYGSLDDAQMANFNEIGMPPAPPLMAAMSQGKAAETKSALIKSALIKSASTKSVETDAVEQMPVTRQAEMTRSSHRRYARHAGHMPQPVRVIGRMLFSLIP